MQEPSKQDIENQLMFSRVGRSTNAMYMVFADHSKDKDIHSVVAQYITKDDVAKLPDEKEDDAAEFRVSSNMDGSGLDFAKKIYNQGIKCRGLQKMKDREIKRSKDIEYRAMLANKELRDRFFEQMDELQEAIDETSLDDA